MKERKHILQKRWAIPSSFDFPTSYQVINQTSIKHQSNIPWRRTWDPSNHACSRSPTLASPRESSQVFATPRTPSPSPSLHSSILLSNTQPQKRKYTFYYTSKRGLQVFPGRNRIVFIGRFVKLFINRNSKAIKTTMWPPCGFTKRTTCSFWIPSFNSLLVDKPSSRLGTAELLSKVFMECVDIPNGSSSSSNISWRYWIIGMKRNQRALSVLFPF